MTSKLTRGPLFAEVHNVPDDYHFTAEELDRIIAGDMFTPRQGAIMARELQEHRKAAMDSEPYGYVHQSVYEQSGSCGLSNDHEAYRDSKTHIPLYLHAQSAKGFESAGWQFKSVNGDWLGLIDEHGKNQAVREGCEVREVFAMADGVNERDQVRRKAASEPVAYLVCNGRLYQDRAFMSPLMAEESVKNRNDGAEIKALCVCGKAECAE